MKFTCSKYELAEAVNTVQRAVAPKNVMPILECIKIESIDGSHILMTGTNIDLTVEYSLDCSISEGGSVALASKIFGEIVRKMPDGDVTIDVNESNNITRISCGASEFNIQGQDSSTFPEAQVLDEKLAFTLEEGKLRNIIRRVLPFIAINEGKRPVLTGALFDMQGGYLNVVTTDSHRIAVVKEEMPQGSEDIKIVVPGMALREIVKVAGDSEENVRLIVGDRKLLFEFEKFRFYTRLLDGDFLKYNAIISAVNPISVRVNKDRFEDCLERAILLINEEASSTTDRKVPVRLNLGFDKLDVSCITSKGQVHDVINAAVSGGELEIGFNCRFLLDALNVCDDEEILVEFSTATSGCFIRSTTGDDSYVYMILPVRLYN